MGKTIKNAVLILLFLTLGISSALLAYLHFFAPKDDDLSGKWTAKIDMTGQAAVTAYSWLQDVEAVSISLEEAESYMQGLTIQVNLTMEQTQRSTGTFQCEISPESYDACHQAAYEAFAAAFHKLLAERLHMAGYADGTDEEAIETLVEETFGMSTVSYLMEYAPALLPSFEELQARYDGSGVYETAEGILTRRFETGGSGTKMEYYIRKDASLILSGEAALDADDVFSEDYPLLYTLEQPE